MGDDKYISVEKRREGEYLVCSGNKCQIVYARNEHEAKEKVMRNR